MRVGARLPVRLSLVSLRNFIDTNLSICLIPVLAMQLSAKYEYSCDTTDTFIQKWRTRIWFAHSILMTRCPQHSTKKLTEL